MSAKIKFATVWLDGCSGCHMSFLDLDERLINLSQKVEIVYSPLVDTKEFPTGVDVTLVEGSVSSTGDLEKIVLVRQRSRILVSLGDCAVTGNVPAMRNPFGVAATLAKGYGVQIPTDSLPALLERVRPVHQIVPVDVIVPGCPPSSDTIFYFLTELLEGRTPDLAGRSRFGS